jgi:hypothetical protein
MVYVCDAPWFTVVTPDGEMVPLEPAEEVMAKVVTADAVNVAEMFFAWFIVTVQVPAPAQSPPQPVNVEPVFGVAVSTTSIPAVKTSEHTAPQFRRRDAEVTVPVPVPFLVAVMR